MLAIGAGTKIFISTGITDMRQGFNGLYNTIKHGFGADPLDGSAIWVFSNKRRNMAKVFFFDAPGGGTWVCAKKLCANTFRWPKAGEKTVSMTSTQLQLLLGGIDLEKTRMRKWWRREAAPAVGAASGGLG
jgi:transposase